MTWVTHSKITFFINLQENAPVRIWINERNCFTEYFTIKIRIFLLMFSTHKKRTFFIINSYDFSNQSGLFYWKNKLRFFKPIRVILLKVLMHKTEYSLHLDKLRFFKTSNVRAIRIFERLRSAKMHNGHGSRDSRLFSSIFSLIHTF